MVDADTFLNAIFNDVQPDAGVVAVGWPEDSGWARRRYTPGMALPDTVYFCPSTIVPRHPRAHALRAEAKDFAYCHVVVLDDVGTKVNPEKILAEPSYILETSPGNFQWGYRITPTPVTEINPLIAALIAAGLTDAGRPNKAGQVMRLPDSLHVKTNFRARVIEWAPSILYAPEVLAAYLEVVVAPLVAPDPFTGAPLVTGESDPVFDYLLNAGLITGGPSTSGWYPMLCPWGDEHTTGGERSTGYHPGSPGGFRCMHGHCAGRTTADLKVWLHNKDITFDDVLPLDLTARFRKAVGAQCLAWEVQKRRRLGLDDTTLRARLVKQIQSIPLETIELHDLDETAKGGRSRSQTVTEARVEQVLQLCNFNIRFNAMTDDAEIEFDTYRSTSDPSHAGYATIVHACNRAGMKKEDAIFRAVENIARTNKYHPAEEWLLSEPWDGRDRLPDLAATLTMREPLLDPWKHVALKRWGIQGARAIRNYNRADPASVGYVLVLQGAENLGKSHWITHLMPPEFVTGAVIMNLNQKEVDTARKATRTPLVELGELDISFKKSDQSALKNFLTSPWDIYRDSYGRKMNPRQRCTFYASSVNPEGFLVDQHGNRRFWPLAISGIDWNFTVNMQQFWAQMAVYEARGEAHDLSKAEQQLHAAASGEHIAESEVTWIMEELKKHDGGRRERQGDWLHRNAKDVLLHFNLSTQNWVCRELSAALQHAGYMRTIVEGKKGFWMPNYGAVLSEAQRKGFSVIDGGARGEHSVAGEGPATP